MLISFAWTTQAVLDRSKYVTRRTWSDGHAAKFHAGDIVDAWDKLPRAGGHKVGTIQLTADPYREALRDMPESDLALEGGFWASKDDFIDGFGGDPDLVVWVIRFTYPDA